MPKAAIDDFNRKVIAEFRAKGGQVPETVRGMPTLLLTHTGAKSGARRTNPLSYSRHGEDLVVLASKRGSSHNPQWFHNVVANPDVTVEVGTETFAARARVAEGEERARLFRAQADAMPIFDEYQSRTTRQIPVIVLERVPEPA